MLWETITRLRDMINLASQTGLKPIMNNVVLYQLQGGRPIGFHHTWPVNSGPPSPLPLKENEGKNVDTERVNR